MGKCKQVKKAQYFLPKNSEFYSNECDKFPNQNFNADTLFSPEQYNNVLISVLEAALIIDETGPSLSHKTRGRPPKKLLD